MIRHISTRAVLSTVFALTAQSAAAQTTAPQMVDDRATFGASFYVGVAVDTFASGDVRTFLNPEANDRHERGVGGFDFSYRIAGEPQAVSTTSNTRWMSQLWIYGETVHGVRSADVDCQKNATFATCEGALAVFKDKPATAADEAFFIIRNATSLEAFTGLRWEFLGIQQKSNTAAASLYLRAQSGFINVAKGPEDMADMRHVAIGATLTNGRYRGSHFEIGLARNDLFQDEPGGRMLVDGLLAREIGNGVSFFAQFTVDADAGPGADSAQTYIGLDFDLAQNPFGW